MATTRDRIIVATNELFRRSGYNGTSLAQISDASGATIGSIYHFFPGGKEALAVAVVETTGAVYRELFEMIASAATDPMEAFADFFDGAAEILRSSGYLDPCPIGGIAREVANTSEPLRIAAAAAFDSWIGAARNHLVGAGVPPETAAELAEVFVSTVEGTFVVSRTQRSTTALLAAGRHLTALAKQAIARPALLPAPTVESSSNSATTGDDRSLAAGTGRDNRQMSASDLPKIGAPAERALASIGVTSLDQLTDKRPAELLALHGFGPRALRILVESLSAQGRSLRPDRRFKPTSGRPPVSARRQA